MAKSRDPRANRHDMLRSHIHFRDVLVSQGEQLSVRVEKGLGQMVARRDRDDEGVIATENYANDLSTAKIERERHTLAEIKDAPARLEVGAYGICEDCHIAISLARLEALPWTRQCVGCAERSAAA